ncbi:hypothetical protein EYF80_005489 [Liparis tanakae]|uniref:Uncharacterized protein n=1 Tax=Liparis tanakae TaxID=230148 RepID=A0A4Z2J3X6_9TELE|nr:hypothetical protein EYF80_005489 [Liparis tanakae]
MSAVHKAYLVVNDMLNVWDIQSPSCHIRRQQNTTEDDIFIRKPFQVLEALLLVHVGMKRQWSPVQDHQQRVQSLDTVYAVGEYHGAAGILKQKWIRVSVRVSTVASFLVRRRVGRLRSMVSVAENTKLLDPAEEPPRRDPIIDHSVVYACVW